MTATIGAITCEESAHGNEKQSDETPEEIEEARSDQDAPPESILIAAGDYPGRGCCSGSTLGIAGMISSTVPGRVTDGFSGLCTARSLLRCLDV
jgi:hypothetical protein